MGNGKYPFRNTTIPESPKSHGLNRHFLRRAHWVIFRSKTLSAAFYLYILYGSVAVQNALENPENIPVYCETVLVHILRLTFFTSTTNIPVIVSLPCINASMEEAAQIDIPIQQVWLPVKFLYEGGVPLKFAKNCRTETVHLYCMWVHFSCNFNTGFWEFC